MDKTTIEDETEKLRQLVISARNRADVERAAEGCLAKLNGIFEKSPDAFTEEDVRFINYLRGTLGVRLDAHRKGGPYPRIGKPKGVKLDHCWRCETPFDSRFKEPCPHCSGPKTPSLICPVCQACGCQKAGRVLA
jgi:hypothetical protein